jgi:hypothetical protein
MHAGYAQDNGREIEFIASLKYSLSRQPYGRKVLCVSVRPVVWWLWFLPCTENRIE